MTHDAVLLLVGGTLLAAGVAAALVAERLRVPALVLFLGIGMAIGTDGFGWIDFADYRAARLIGTAALTLILFEAGMESGFDEIRPVLRPALLLAIVGTAVTAAVSGLAAAALFDFSLQEGLLLGAIVSATDGAAVFALLRASRLPRRVAQTLEGEAGLNDPVAVMLVLVLVDIIQHPGYQAGSAAGFLAREIAIGCAGGVLVGAAGASVLRRLSGPPGVPLVASFSTAALAYGCAASLHGSGFLAVYLAGLAVGSARLPERPSLLSFHAGLAAVAEMGMFLALGLLVFPSQLGDVAVKGTLLALVVAAVARPVAVAVATASERFTGAERILLGWAGLRGAVPVVLATLPVIAGVPHSLEFFNLVFFAVLVSTVVQGTTVTPLARRLGLTELRRPG